MFSTGVERKVNSQAVGTAVADDCSVALSSFGGKEEEEEDDYMCVK